MLLIFIDGCSNFTILGALTVRSDDPLELRWETYDRSCIYTSAPTLLEVLVVRLSSVIEFILHGSLAIFWTLLRALLR